MKNEFRWSFRLKILMYTALSMAAAIISDIFVVLLCVRFNILTYKYKNSSLISNSAGSAMNNAARNMNSGVTSINASANTDASGAILGEKDIFYRLFGVSIKWPLFILMIAVLLLVFMLVFMLLTSPMTSYMDRIVLGISRIADGDFSERIPLLQEDEFSYIADNINKLAQNVETMTKTTQEAEQTKNDLITNVAHDLRTPLTSIIGYIDLASAGSSLSDEDKARYLNIAGAKAHKLNKLIEELFSFTKISYGHQPMNKTKIDLMKLLEQEIDELYPVFEDHNLKCEFHQEVKSAMIYADGDQMVRVFENLLSNAVRYGSDGKLIQVFSKTENDKVQVRVINFGNVIPKESLPFLFEKFYKVDSSRRESSGGTGLGLSIAKAIVEDHGGSISADSSLDGTVFTVTLPLYKEE